MRSDIKDALRQNLRVLNILPAAAVEQGSRWRGTKLPSPTEAALPTEESGRKMEAAPQWELFVPKRRGLRLEPQQAGSAADEEPPAEQRRQPSLTQPWGATDLAALLRREQMMMPFGRRGGEMGG